LEAEVDQLQHEVDAVEVEMQQMQESDNAVEDEVAQLQQDVDAVEVEMQQMQESDNAVEAEVAQLQQDVDAVEVVMQQMQESDNAVEAEVDQIQLQVDVVEAEVEQLQQYVDELSTQMILNDSVLANVVIDVATSNGIVVSDDIVQIALNDVAPADALRKELPYPHNYYQELAKKQ
jgi:chromosome segregation ATPase